MVLSKSDLRDPLKPSFFLGSEKNSVYLQKTLLVPIDHHAIFKMFKLSFLWNFLGHFQKSLTGSESMCRSIMNSSFSKMVLKRVSSFKKISHFDCKNGQKMPETCDGICLDPQNPHFCIKDKKNYIYKM